MMSQKLQEMQSEYEFIKGRSDDKKSDSVDRELKKL